MAKKMTLEEFIDHYTGAAFDDEQMISACMDKLKPGTPLYNRAVALLVAREAFFDLLDEIGLELG